MKRVNVNERERECVCERILSLKHWSIGLFPKEDVLYENVYKQ